MGEYDGGACATDGDGQGTTDVSYLYLTGSDIIAA